MPVRARSEKEPSPLCRSTETKSFGASFADTPCFAVVQRLVTPARNECSESAAIARRGWRSEAKTSLERWLAEGTTTYSTKSRVSTPIEVKMAQERMRQGYCIGLWTNGVNQRMMH